MHLPILGILHLVMRLHVMIMQFTQVLFTCCQQICCASQLLSYHSPTWSTFLRHTASPHAQGVSQWANADLVSAVICHSTFKFANRSLPAQLYCFPLLRNVLSAALRAHPSKNLFLVLLTSTNTVHCLTRLAVTLEVISTKLLSAQRVSHLFFLPRPLFPLAFKQDRSVINVNANTLRHNHLCLCETITGINQVLIGSCRCVPVVSTAGGPLGAFHFSAGSVNHRHWAHNPSIVLDD